jgi:hypothetical protein
LRDNELYDLHHSPVVGRIWDLQGNQVDILKHIPTDELMRRCTILEQKIVQIGFKPLYPPPGYIYPHAHLRQLQEDLDKLIQELQSRTHPSP